MAVTATDTAPRSCSRTGVVGERRHEHTSLKKMNDNFEGMNNDPFKSYQEIIVEKLLNHDNCSSCIKSDNLILILLETCENAT